MKSRRDFLMAGAVASGFSVARLWSAKTSDTAFPYEEFEARIARRDFREMTKDVLPTPCMVVDLDLFQQNIQKMAGQAKSAGIYVRPHVKVHKSVDVARYQIGQGAIGLTCATIAEAELFSGAGIKNILWTKQPASVNNIQRAVALSKKDPTFMFVADDPQVVDWVEQAASASNTKLRIAVSVYAGMARQGIENGQPAVELAQRLAGSKQAAIRGLYGLFGECVAHQDLGSATEAILRRSGWSAGDHITGAQIGPSGKYSQWRLDGHIQYGSRSRPD